MLANLRMWSDTELSPRITSFFEKYLNEEELFKLGILKAILKLDYMEEQFDLKNTVAEINPDTLYDLVEKGLIRKKIVERAHASSHLILSLIQNDYGFEEGWNSEEIRQVSSLKKHNAISIKN